MDTACTAKEAGYDEVYLIIDLCRPAHVEGTGFLTPPHELLAKCREYGVKLCLSTDCWP